MNLLLSSLIGVPFIAIALWYSRRRRSGFTTGSGTFTAPQGGYYRIQGKFQSVGKDGVVGLHTEINEVIRAQDDADLVAQTNRILHSTVKPLSP